LSKLVNIFQSEPAKPTPAEIQPHKIQPSLTPVVRIAPKNSDSKPKPNSQVAKNIATDLRTKLSSDTTVEMPGESGVSYANYGMVVASVYHDAWISPDDMANDSALVKFSVSIASDGTVINAHIIEPSGDANVDAAVQRMLNRVASIAPFPEGTTEKERTYTINFNASRTTE
jgi:TonB family protein